MSITSCPMGGSDHGSRSSSSCPVGRVGPRGCAFSAYQMTAPSSYTPYGTPQDAQSEQFLRSQERKTMNELLLPEAPPKEVTKGLKNADALNPVDTDVLAMALGAPARRVLTRAMELGPKTGWKDGYLSSQWGFCPPDPSAAPVALSLSPGRVWSDLCERMPGIVARGKVRESILALPLVFGTPDVIPDAALWAATVCLGILASIYRYEEANDGSEGISVAAPPGAFRNLTGDADDEEEETKGIPRNVAIPLRQICTRMGRVLPHLTQFDVSIYNYKIRDHTSIHPYLPRCENMDLRWPVFNDRGEAMFLLCMAESHGCFIPGVEIIARCQECVMLKDEEGLLLELVKLKQVVDQLPHVFHKISVNPNSGENFANPVEWGQRYAKFSAPLSRRVPALSGLALPLFLLMDAFMGRTKYDSFLGLEALHLRAWLPMNIRAFIAAVEYNYKVPDFVNASNNPRLKGVLEGLVESYMGERGWMGTHRYKVYGFLEVVAKTGRSETNGNAGAGDNAGRPWEMVHKSLSESMKERLDPYRGTISHQPHEMRGSFEECRFKAPIINRQFIDSDPSRSTAMITFDLHNTGITFMPGDRLAVMPLNTWNEVAKVAAALGLEDMLDRPVPTNHAPEWGRFAKHLASVSRTPNVPDLTVRDILRRGHLAPLTKDLVMAFHTLLRAGSSTTLKLLACEEWPIPGTVGDLLQFAVEEVASSIWDQAFDLKDLSWLPKLIPIEVPRTYSISNYSNGLLPDSVDLTVSRSNYHISPALQIPGQSTLRHGVSSGYLNFDLSESHCTEDEEPLLIGVSRPLNFQLPVSVTVPIAMFAGGSGIAPFRGFWQSRTQSAFGRNILFLGTQSREKLLYEDELRNYVRHDMLEVHTAFSRDRNGLVYDPVSKDLVEKEMEPRYIDTTIIEQGQTVCNLVISKSQGGLGGYIYICGSVSVYETIISGIRQAIYNNWASTKESAENLLAVAFAERRFMLDIFMTPQPISYNSPIISLAQLAQHTGHKPNSRMWLAVHGGVYDVTDFLPMHPGGTLIVRASAGLDATKTFDELAHTSNPEVSSLLSKYFIGHLAPKPSFHSPELSELYDTWHVYLRTCVESLTTLHLEVDHIMQDSKVWFQNGLFNMGGVRKFYQFQSRLMQNGFSMIFGVKMQELHLKLSYALASLKSGSSTSRFPDIIGIVTRAQSSPASAQASNEIAQIGQFVCNSQGAQFQENGILKYAQTVTALDVEFLEEILSEVCKGMESFEGIKRLEDGRGKQGILKISAYLLIILERIAQRLEIFYSRLATHTIYTPALEANPARTRWNILRRKISNGSFFILAHDSDFDHPAKEYQNPYRSTRHEQQDVDFDDVVKQVRAALSDSDTPYQNTTKVEPGHGGRQEPSRERRGLAAEHTLRAQPNLKSPSSFEVHEQRSALNRISMFMDKNTQSINRLSQMPGLEGVSYQAILNAYGGVKGRDSPLPPVPPLPSSANSLGQSKSPLPRDTTLHHRRQQSPATIVNLAPSTMNSPRNAQRRAFSPADLRRVPYSSIDETISRSRASSRGSVESDKSHSVGLRTRRPTLLDNFAVPLGLKVRGQVGGGDGMSAGIGGGPRSEGGGGRRRGDSDRGRGLGIRPITVLTSGGGGMSLRELRLGGN
ncbi:hypothetical protein IFR04_015186 [Cadophora malorum]|uniref:NADPH--hemoprotein reductase n=1 Tax=Cadophora malorum TaxID=108018 RepID=A0A8H7W478_9HELO|nr:hypothetical protein IFR04_015186 [Cadophora malorum]